REDPRAPEAERHLHQHLARPRAGRAGALRGVDPRQARRRRARRLGGRAHVRRQSDSQPRERGVLRAHGRCHRRGDPSGGHAGLGRDAPGPARRAARCPGESGRVAAPRPEVEFGMPIDTRHPREIRQDIRNGKIKGITAGLGQNFVQANLAVLPRDHAYDFLLFCQRNPRPCPLIEVTDVGSPEPVGVAPGADLRTDIPRYRIYKDGVLADEVTDAPPYWRGDRVAFLLGCSFTFEWALLEAGIKLWHVEHGKNVAMWRTSTQCRPAGAFHGPMVVSMRPIPSAQLAKAVTASARFPGAHGAPVHVGDPAASGMPEFTRPDWGDAQEFARGDVPVFWACGVTPQAVALASRPPFMITHSPGHMFITDLPNSALAAI